MSISVCCGAIASAAAGHPAVSAQDASPTIGCQLPPPAAVGGGAAGEARVADGGQCLRSSAREDATACSPGTLPVLDSASGQEPAGSATSRREPASTPREEPGGAPGISAGGSAGQTRIRDDGPAAAPELGAQPGAALPPSPTGHAAAASLGTAHVCGSRAEQYSRIAADLREPWAPRAPPGRRRGGAGAAAQPGALGRLLCCAAPGCDDDALGEQREHAAPGWQTLSAHALTARGVVSSARTSASRAETRHLSTLAWVGWDGHHLFQGT